MASVERPMITSSVPISARTLVRRVFDLQYGFAIVVSSRQHHVSCRARHSLWRVRSAVARFPLGSHAA